MKEKVIIFIIGLLVGSIISTGSIYFYTIAEGKNNDNVIMQKDDFGGRDNMNQNNNNGNPPEMPNNDMGNPPEIPNNN